MSIIKYGLATWKEDHSGCQCNDELELFDTEDAARRAYDEYDLAHWWKVEYECSNHVCTKPLFKELCIIEIDEDGNIADYGGCIERDWYDWDNHIAEIGR